VEEQAAFYIMQLMMGLLDNTKGIDALCFMLELRQLAITKSGLGLFEDKDRLYGDVLLYVEGSLAPPADVEESREPAILPSSAAVAIDLPADVKKEGLTPERRKAFEIIKGHALYLDGARYPQAIVSQMKADIESLAADATAKPKTPFWLIHSIYIASKVALGLGVENKAIASRGFLFLKDYDFPKTNFGYRTHFVAMVNAENYLAAKDYRSAYAQCLRSVPDTAAEMNNIYFASERLLESAREVRECVTAGFEKDTQEKALSDIWAKLDHAHKGLNDRDQLIFKAKVEGFRRTLFDEIAPDAQDALDTYDPYDDL
jgi:hypothetical protein